MKPPTLCEESSAVSQKRIFLINVDRRQRPVYLTFCTFVSALRENPSISESHPRVRQKCRAGLGPGAAREDKQRLAFTPAKQSRQRLERYSDLDQIFLVYAF